MTITVKDGSGNLVALPSSASGAPVHSIEAGTANIGRTSLPTATGRAASGATTIATAGTYQPLFASGSIVNGAFIQNPANSGASLFVDVAGATGTTLAPTSQEIVPGATWQAAFVPTNAITVFCPTVISFRAGAF